MNSDFRVSVDFFVHHKTKKLKKRLGSDGIVALLQLWSYAAQFRPDGSLYGMEEEDIELAVDWPGDEGVFVHTLKTIGFLDEDDDGLRLHDWQENNPWAATSESRSDASRLSRMAKVFPNEYQALVNAGVKGITKKDYETLRTSNDRLSYVHKIIDEYKQQSNDRATSTGQLLNDMSTKNNDSSTTVKRPLTNPLSPAPSPSPDPTPIVKNTPLTPQGETPGADAPASVSAQEQEAQEQPAPFSQPEAQPEQPTLSPEQPAKPKRKKGRKDRRDELPVRPQDFDRWYSLFPRKDAKQDAVCAWNDADEEGVLPEITVLEKALEWQIQANDWNPRTRRNYIPMPATYLNARRWRDEPPKFASQSFQQNTSYRPQYNTNNGGMDKFEAQRLCGQQYIEELVQQGFVTDSPSENKNNSIEAELVSPFQLPQAHM